MIPQPRIYSCAEWAAKPARHGSEDTQPSLVVVHHMAWPNRELLSDKNAALHKAFEVALSCQAGHFANGWADTGQHFTITRDGVILEGRHGSLAAAQAGHCLNGAHAADPDTGANANGSWGIECEGTYSYAEMPAPQWKALIALCAWLCQQTKVRSDQIVGHRDTGCRTACPGDALYARLPQARKQVHDLLAGSTQAVPAPPKPVAPPKPTPVPVAYTRQYIAALLEAAAAKHGIPVDVLKGVAWQESRWLPAALSFDGQHGKGVMQIDDRWHDFAKTPAVFDPAANIEYGATLLASLHRQYGGWTAACQHYNGSGPAAEAYGHTVMRWSQQRPWEH